MELGYQNTVSFSELKNKQVINVSDGAVLGHVSDVHIEFPQGRLSALLLPSPLRSGFRRETARIPIEQIERIGEDIILVRAGGIPTAQKPLK